MSEKIALDLGNVQKTLLLPLWGRAIETQKQKPLLIDHTAVSIIQKLAYDFTVIAQNISKPSQLSWIARSIYFDQKIKAFIDRYPEATVVNLGCGLDTTFNRIDNGRINWIDLDLPDVIQLRKKVIPETERRQCISASVFDLDWFSEITNTEQLMFMFAGVLYYFEEKDIRELFSRFLNHFPGVEIIFDYSSNRGIKLANKMVIKRGGMDESANLIWGIDNIHNLEKWNCGISVLDTMPMYYEFKKNYPVYKRIGMNISDALKIMSLAHIRIG